MEKEKQDAVFWLPSEFLDDDFLAEEDKSKVSLTASNEEEDYLAGLTKQMAHSTLLNDEKERSSTKSENPKVMAGSPQSTLCDHESSDGPSEVNSPPSTPLKPRKEDSWDLLYEATGQVLRMRLNQAHNTYAAQGF